MYINECVMSSFTPIQLHSKLYKLIGILSFCKLRMSSKVWDYIPYIMDIYVYTYSDYRFHNAHKTLPSHIIYNLKYKSND